MVSDYTLTNSLTYAVTMVTAVVEWVLCCLEQRCTIQILQHLHTELVQCYKIQM